LLALAHIARMFLMRLAVGSKVTVPWVCAADRSTLTPSPTLIAAIGLRLASSMAGAEIFVLRAPAATPSPTWQWISYTTSCPVDSAEATSMIWKSSK
ncbi:MAG: hypothetical protein ACK559_35015, partial [bacterium]